MVYGNPLSAQRAPDDYQVIESDSHLRILPGCGPRVRALANESTWKKQLNHEEHGEHEEKQDLVLSYCFTQRVSIETVMFSGFLGDLRALRGLNYGF